MHFDNLLVYEMNSFLGFYEYLLEQGIDTVPKKKKEAI